jgi:AAA15 family ATPase/GTPase
LFNSLKIKHFRGIENLEINSLGRLNLFVGENNSGKTTILDALFMITNPANPKLIINTNNFRGFPRIDENFFSSFFHNFDISRNIEIDVSTKKLINRKLLIKIHDKNDLSYESDVVSNDISLDTQSSSKNFGSSIDGVDLFTRTNDGFNLLSTIRTTSEGIKFEQHMYTDDLKGVYLSSNNSNINETRFEKIIVDKKLDYIIDILRIIKKDLYDIRLGSNGLLYCDIGLEKYIPINAMGDGIQKLLNIIIAMYDSKGGGVYIDEFENGIYYSKFDEIWTAVTKAAVDFDVQVFATSHSIECINSFSRVNQKQKHLFDRNSENLLFRVEQKKNTHKAIVYDPELLDASISHGFEIR